MELDMNLAFHSIDSPLVRVPVRNCLGFTAHTQKITADLYFSGCSRADELFDLPRGTLLHAGPPLSSRRRSPVLLEAALRAACSGGLAETPEAARRMIDDGAITLRPAHDFNVVTRLGVVVSGSSMLAGVADRGVLNRRAFVPVTDVIAELTPGTSIAPEPEDAGTDMMSDIYGLQIAARKCLLQAAENVAGSTIVTALASNGTDIGIQLSGLGREWLSTDDLWLRFGIMRLKAVDKGILGEGDWLLRFALSARDGQLVPLDASDWFYGKKPEMAQVLREIPENLFSMALARVRPFHWSLFLPPH
jgi:hypothetical protein